MRYNVRDLGFGHAKCPYCLRVIPLYVMGVMVEHEFLGRKCNGSHGTGSKVLANDDRGHKNTDFVGSPIKTEPQTKDIQLELTNELLAHTQRVLASRERDLKQMRELLILLMTWEQGVVVIPKHVFNEVDLDVVILTMSDARDGSLTVSIRKKGEN